MTDKKNNGNGGLTGIAVICGFLCLMASVISWVGRPYKVTPQLKYGDKFCVKTEFFGQGWCTAVDVELGSFGTNSFVVGMCSYDSGANDKRRYLVEEVGLPAHEIVYDKDGQPTGWTKDMYCPGEPR